MAGNGGGNLQAAAAISKRVVLGAGGQARQLARGQHMAGGRQDALGPGAHQQAGAAGDDFGALGHIAHHQYGLAQGWRFFLHAAGIRQHDIGTLHQALIHEQERSGAAWALEWMVLPQMAQAAGRALLTAAALASQVQRIGTPE